jgi:glycerophosphoryl diester phosphodiesterase
MLRRESQKKANNWLTKALSTALTICALVVVFPSEIHAQNADMLIIAHRGASVERPEHTLVAYEKAIDQGADYIEPDLVVTKDLVLIARHENELSDSTDVASREEFEGRRREKTIDGQRVAGWFAEDFTLAEIRTLRAKERFPTIRRANVRFNGLYQVPTFEEIITLVRAKEAETGRKIGLYPELKHANFLLQEAGIDMVDLLVGQLRKEGLDGADAKVIVQSFEVGPLRRLDRRVDVKLAQLVESAGGPVDEPTLRYEEMISPSGLEEIAAYADMIAVDMRLILGEDGSPTSLVADARAAGLAVHGWTLRPENAFLPPTLRSGGGEAAHGDMGTLAKLLQEAGVEGVFTDAVGLLRNPKP